MPTTELNSCPIKDLRSFGLIVGGIFFVIFGLLIPLLKAKPLHLTSLVIGGILIIIAALAPKILNPIYIIWMKVGTGLGYINNKLILGIVFCCIVVPLGFLMRVFARNPLQLKFDSSAKSYKIPRSSQMEPKNMERPF